MYMHVCACVCVCVHLYACCRHSRICDRVLDPIHGITHTLHFLHALMNTCARTCQSRAFITALTRTFIICVHHRDCGNMSVHALHSQVDIGVGGILSSDGSICIPDVHAGVLRSGAVIPSPPSPSGVTLCSVVTTSTAYPGQPFRSPGGDGRDVAKGRRGQWGMGGSAIIVTQWVG